MYMRAACGSRPGGAAGSLHELAVVESLGEAEVDELGASEETRQILSPLVKR